ncbi:MAG: hypothetical protein H9W82_16330 [Lactobacillus sp.]|nr:hypothetical protein [Lactobacillus sp.]
MITASDGLSCNVKTVINGDIANHQLPLLTNYYDAIFYLTDNFVESQKTQVEYEKYLE